MSEGKQKADNKDVGKTIDMTNAKRMDKSGQTSREQTDIRTREMKLKPKSTKTNTDGIKPKKPKPKHHQGYSKQKPIVDLSELTQKL